MRSLSQYKDKWGLLAQDEENRRDGGDTAQREGMYYYGMYLKTGTTRLVHQFKRSLALLSNDQDQYRRHPNPDKWYSHWDRMSRDQMTPLIIAMGAYGLHDRLFRFMLKWLARGMFMTNTRRNGMYPTKREHEKKQPSWHKWDYSYKLPDFSPTFIGLFIRAFRAWYLYPILIITDIELLLGALLLKYQSETAYANRTGDDLNYIMRTLQAKEVYQTPISVLARYVYKQRPHLIRDLGHKLKHQTYDTDSAPQSALQWYFRVEKHDPCLDLLYKDVVEGL